MGLPEALISTLGNLISALAELVAAISGDIKMVLKPASVHKALGGRSFQTDDRPISNNSQETGELRSNNIYKNPDINLSVPEIIRKYGFPLESHKVVTKDKYILTVFRIPHGRKGQSLSDRPPVLLVHGLLNSSGAWIMHDSDKALAYKLADKGYDCWMANCRGTTYSRTHETLTTADKEFWDFSFHEMGLYDVPAIIDLILEKTKKPNLYFIGHSLGNNMLMVAISQNDKLNEKIRLTISLAPAIYLYLSTAKLLSLPSPFFQKQKAILDYFSGNGELMPRTFLQNFTAFSPFVPNPEYLATKCVTASMYTMGGYNPDQIYLSQLPVVAAHTPVSTSVKTYIHCLQYFNARDFKHYDYGSSENNLKAYGQSNPPKYDLTKVTTPVAIFWGANDMLCRPETVGRFASELPNVIGSFRVECDKFSHTDFLYAKDVDKLVYDKVINLMEMFP